MMTLMHSTHSEVWFKTILIGILTAAALAIFRYKAAVRKSLDALKNAHIFGTPTDPFRMIRTSGRNSSERSTKIQMVALNPEFRALHDKKDSSWNLLDLGEYLSSLRPSIMPNSQFPQFIEKEIQALVAGALIKQLGPQFGAAVLPVLLGTSTFRNVTAAIANKATAVFTTAESKVKVATEKDQGGVPLSVFAVTYAAELNYQRLQIDKKTKKTTEEESQAKKLGPWPHVTMTPWQLLRAGEVGFKPSFDATLVSGDEKNTPLIPNPFVLTADWTKTIERMEYLLRNAADHEYQWTDTPNQEQTNVTNSTVSSPPYDPDSRALKAPEPIHERLLPDLYLGWGDVQCTHTQREILHNRLLSVLLNRLASNYPFSSKENDVKEAVWFTVMVLPEENKHSSSNVITKPADLIHALVQTGHYVEASIRTQSTTFGVALCVKESIDGDSTKPTKWANIPLAYFMQTGYTDASGRDAYTCLPHSGLNLEVRDGQIIKRASVQHYISLEGLCGWNSNHNVDVPWIRPLVSGPILSNEHDVAEAVRVAALQSVVLNGVSTRLDLPFGGYGLTGVCNDSAACIEYAISNTTHIYPLTMNGRFAMQSLRVASELLEALQSTGSNRQENADMQDADEEAKDIQSLRRLMAALRNLPSDNNSLPVVAEDQCRRLLHCLNPEVTIPPFELMKQTREVIESIQEEMTQWNKEKTNT